MYHVTIKEHGRYALEEYQEDNWEQWSSIQGTENTTRIKILVVFSSDICV